MVGLKTKHADCRITFKVWELEEKCKLKDWKNKALNGCTGRHFRPPLGITTRTLIFKGTSVLGSQAVLTVRIISKFRAPESHQRCILQLRHLVYFGAIWLLHLDIQRKLHTKHWFVLSSSIQLLFGIPVVTLTQMLPGGPASDGGTRVASTICWANESGHPWRTAG